MHARYTCNSLLEAFSSNTQVPATTLWPSTMHPEHWVGLLDSTGKNADLYQPPTHPNSPLPRLFPRRHLRHGTVYSVLLSWMYFWSWKLLSKTLKESWAILRHQDCSLCNNIHTVTYLIVTHTNRWRLCSFCSKYSVNVLCFSWSFWRSAVHTLSWASISFECSRRLVFSSAKIIHAKHNYKSHTNGIHVYL